MSTESEIEALIIHATAAASTLAGDARSLVNAAEAALKVELDFPGLVGAGPKESGVSNQFYGGVILNPDGEPYNNGQPGNSYFGGLVGGAWVPSDTMSADEEPPVSFPAWPTVSLGSAPNTQALDTVDLDIDRFDFPTLSFPTFRYSKLARPPAFNGTVPNTFVEKATPTVPEAVSLYDPSFIEPTAVDSVAFNRPEVELDPLAISLPVWNDPFGTTYDALLDSLGGEDGPNTLIGELEQWYLSDLSGVLDPALILLKDRMQNKLSPVWTGYTALRERLTTRLSDEEDRVRGLISNTSGWQAPAAVTVAQTAWVNQMATAWKAFAEEQVDVAALKMAVDWFQVCGELTTYFTTAVQKLKEREIQLILEAHKTALAYAKATIAALLAGYEAGMMSASLVLLREEAQLKAFEAELTVALLQYEEAQFKLKSEEAQQAFDEVQVKKLRNEVAQAQQTVQLAASQVASARLEVALRRMPLEQFVNKVKAFGAQVNAHEAQVGALLAEVEGDEARVKGQLKKLAGYKAELDAFQSLIAAKQVRATAQSERNAAVIEEFQLRVKAALAPVEKEALDAGYEFKKYGVQVDKLIADAQLALETAKLELNYRIKQQEGQREAYQLAQERDFNVVQSELSRLEGIASVNAKGAAVMAEMSSGAMSAINSIASVVYGETV